MSLSKHKATTICMILSRWSIKLCQMYAPLRIPLEAILPSLFPNFFHYKVILGKFVYMFLKYRLKLGQNNIEVSFRHYSNACIAANSAFFFDNQPMHQVPYSWKFSPGKKFHPGASWVKIFSANYFTQ